MSVPKDSSYWPRIDSEEKAIKVMHQGAYAAAFSAVVTGGLSIAALCLGRAILGLNG